MLCRQHFKYDLCTGTPFNSNTMHIQRSCSFSGIFEWVLGEWESLKYRACMLERLWLYSRWIACGVRLIVSSGYYSYTYNVYKLSLKRLFVTLFLEMIWNKKKNARNFSIQTNNRPYSFWCTQFQFLSSSVFKNV